MNLEDAERLAIQRQENPVSAFEDAFRKTQDALGLNHYHVYFREYAENKDGNYAEIEVDPEACVAVVEIDRARCIADGVEESSAVHECCHLLLADLKHALDQNPRAARSEEERLVRRLEPILVRLLGK